MTLEYEFAFLEEHIPSGFILIGLRVSAIGAAEIIESVVLAFEAIKLAGDQMQVFRVNVIHYVILLLIEDKVNRNLTLKK